MFIVTTSCFVATFLAVVEKQTKKKSTGTDIVARLSDIYISQNTNYLKADA